jgi:hypothetical protein
VVFDRDRRAAEEHADFTGELTRTVRGDQEVVQAGGTDDLDPTSHHNKNGTSVWPGFDQHLPRVIGRITPWEAIRAICPDVSVGNMSAAFAALVSGVERVVSVTAPLPWAHTLNRAHVNRLTNSSAFSATSRQPASIVSACPRPVIFTISVAPLLRFSFL